jgi:hypothetical protein
MLQINVTVNTIELVGTEIGEEGVIDMMNKIYSNTIATSGSNMSKDGEFSPL